MTGSEGAAAAGRKMAAEAGGTTRVWDPVVRLFHWALVLTVTTAWLSAEEWDGLHEWAGYVVAALLAIRLLWGLVGTRHARFSRFLRGPGAVAGYFGDMLRGRERRHLGHNPAGAAMILALIFVLAGICATGWLQTTDAYWGVEWVEEVHEILANLLLALVGLHLLGVLLASLRHRENLVRAMITGRKRTASGADLD